MKHFVSENRLSIWLREESEDRDKCNIPGTRNDHHFLHSRISYEIPKNKVGHFKLLI